MEHVTQFYSSLYDEKPTNSNYEELLSGCPNPNDAERESLNQEITLDELEKTVTGCANSAPRQDGIPYKVYKKLWKQTGPFLLKYSLQLGILPYDQRLSITTITKER